MGCALKDSFKFNRYSTCRQDKDEEVLNLFVFFLFLFAIILFYSQIYGIIK